MGQRNTLCNHRLLDLQLGQGISHFHPDHCILSGNVADYTNRSIHPGISAPVITAEQGLLFRDYPDRSTFYGSQYNCFQNFHAVPNLGITAAAPSNFYTPCMFPPPSSRTFTVPHNNGTSDPSAIIMDEFGRSQFIDNIRGFGKRKNAEVPSGNQHHTNELASSSSSSAFLSLNCGSSQWEHSHEPVLNPSDSANFEHPEYQERGNIQAVDGSHRSVRSRSSVVNIQPEPMYLPHPNYGLQAAHLGQSIRPASNVWMAHFGTENNIGDGACSNWNYNHPVTYLQGRCIHPGAFELTNMGVQAFPDSSSSTNTAVLFNPTSLPNFHQHLLPARSMQLQSYSHQVQMPAHSYHHPPNNLHPVDVNSTHSLQSGSRFPYFPPNAQQIFRPPHVHHAPLDFARGSMEILSSQDAAAMDVSGFYGVGNAIDQHQEMRLDIDAMSYEELLELEERIGHVKTGLTEERIVRNLKTNVHNSQTKFLLSDGLPRFSSEETEACIICQVEYVDDEIIGTLDCGHSYHGECIKRWLLEKNLCPICKKTALARDNREG